MPKTILVFVAAVCAIAFFANIVVRNFLLPAAALVLLLVSSLVIGVAYPAIVQQFVVKPSAEREGGALHRAGDRRRRARPTASPTVELRRLRAGQHRRRRSTPQAALAELRNDTETIPNARLLDPNVLSDDVHRPPADPQRLRLPREARHRPVHATRRRTTRDYVVAVRELNSAGPVGEPGQLDQPAHRLHARQRLRRRAGERGRRRPGGRRAELHHRGPADQRQHRGRSSARIYYGELIQQGGQDVYSVVGAPEGATPREFDQPEGGSDEGQINNTYDGDGGVSIGSFFRQLTFAIYYRERNFLLSSAVNDDSRVLYVRDPRDRVEKAAPFLEVDGDPYPGGRSTAGSTWILDGYTTSDAYPYSERCEPGEAASRLADRHRRRRRCPTSSSTTSATR